MIQLTQVILEIRAQWDRCWGPKGSKIETGHQFSIVKLNFRLFNSVTNANSSATYIQCKSILLSVEMFFFFKNNIQLKKDISFFSFILLLQLAWAHLSIGQRSKKSNKSRLQKVKQVKAWNLSQCNENLIMKNGSLKILWKILINHNLLLKTAQLAFALQALIIPLFSSSSPSPPFPFLILVLFDSCFF